MCEGVPSLAMKTVATMANLERKMAFGMPILIKKMYLKTSIADPTLKLKTASLLPFLRGEFFKTENVNSRPKFKTEIFVP